jgi:hypothetical protein
MKKPCHKENVHNILILKTIEPKLGVGASFVEKRKYNHCYNDLQKVHMARYEIFI